MHKWVDRFWAKVNKIPDGCWLWTAAQFKPTGYGQFRFEGTSEKAHRISYEILVGPIPEGMELDHTCHNRLCVNPEHLRLATRLQNARNTRIHSNNKCGFKGVCWSPRLKKWRATIYKDGKQCHLGMYPTPEEAHEAYKIAAKDAHLEFYDEG